MRARRLSQVGWALGLCALVTGACSPADPGTGVGPPSSNAGNAVQIAVATASANAPVPADFPKMLGCNAEELANPSDPATRAGLTRVCDVAQAGLYAISQDARLTESEQTHHALMLMGATLERMTQILDAAQQQTDAGTSP